MTITFEDKDQAQDFYVAIIDEIADNEKTAKKYFGKPEYKADVKALDKDTKILKKVQKKYEDGDFDFTIEELELITIAIDEQIDRKWSQADDFRKLNMHESAEAAQNDYESLKRLRGQL